MVRLKDIAAQAGVSLMTVSKVLRDEHDVSAATRARVRQIAQQMGYSPDILAQALRTRKSRLIGLVLPTVTNPVFARAVVAIEEIAFEMGYNIVLAHSLNKETREDQVIRGLLARRMDALIVSPVYRLSPEAPIYHDLTASKIPGVILGHRAPFCGQLPNVETDDLFGSYECTRHLLSLGHRQIAFFAGPAAAPGSHEQIEGHRRALGEANLEYNERLVFAAGSTIEDGEKVCLQMLNEDIHPTAIQTSSDLVAVGAISVLTDQGLRIPQDISITGFGDILLGEYSSIPLTTVHQPKFRLGTAAMDIVRRLLKNEPAESRRLATELIVRESTAPVRTM